MALRPVVAHVAEPGDLQRRGPASENAEAVARVAGQVEEHIDLVAANLLSDGLVGESRRSPAKDRLPHEIGP